MRTLSLTFLLSVATLTASASLQLEPAAPTERSFIVAKLQTIWPTPCLPQDPSVHVVGNQLYVSWSEVASCPCAYKVPWETEVPVGVLEPNDYAVVAHIRGSGEIVGRGRLVVRDHDPAVLVSPNLISSRQKTTVTLTRRGDVGFCRPPVEVRVNGVVVESSSDGCPLTVELDRPAPGPLTVSVTERGETWTAFGAANVQDPEAAPDPGVYERMLVPILLDGRGAFGSSWETEAKIVNRSFRDLAWVPEVAKPLPVCDDDGNCSRASSLPAQKIESLDMFGVRANGLVLFVPRDLSQWIRFTSLVRNPDDRSQYGIEVPVVRESDLFTGRFLVGEVDFDPRYRLHLRVYGIDGASLPVSVAAVRPDHWLEYPMQMTAPCMTSELPCNSNAPAFGAIDLHAAFPDLTGAGRYRVYVYPRTNETLLRYWGFLSIVDNATQHVTVMTPQ